LRDRFAAKRKGVKKKGRKGRKGGKGETKEKGMKGGKEEPPPSPEISNFLYGYGPGRGENAARD